MVAQLTSPLPCDARIPHGCQFMSLLLHFQPSSLLTAWTSSRGWPKSFMGDPVEAPGSHLWISSALALAACYRMNQWMEDPLHLFSL